MPVIDVAVPEALLPLTEPYPYKVVSHGRGAGGSWTFARMLLIRGLSGKEVVLCCRETQTSIRDSVHQLLREQIDLLGLQDSYRVLDTEIRGPGKTRFIFRGLRTNPRDIKSAEGVTIAWVAEAEAVSQQSWDILIPTVMRQDDAEIWVEFNPRSPDDPTYQIFVANRQPGEWYCHLTWRDNPWFPARLREEKDHLLATNRPKHDHIYEGVPLLLTEARVFNPTEANYYADAELDKWVGANKELEHAAMQPFVLHSPIQARCDVRLIGALDFGFEDADAFAVVAYSINPNHPEHWVVHEYKARRESISEYADAIHAGLEQVDDWATRVGIINRTVRLVSDFGGGGKDIAWELYKHHGIRCFDAAVKTNKDMGVDILRDEVAEGRLRIRKGGPLDDEFSRTVWQRDEQERIVRKIDDTVYHPDITWSVIYALRATWQPLTQGATA